MTDRTILLTAALLKLLILIKLTAALLKPILRFIPVEALCVTVLHQMVSEASFKIKLHVLFGYFDPEKILPCNAKHSWGDLTNVSTEKDSVSETLSSNDRDGFKTCPVQVELGWICHLIPHNEPNFARKNNACQQHQRVLGYNEVDLVKAFVTNLSLGLLRPKSSTLDMFSEVFKGEILVRSPCYLHPR